MVLDIWPVLLRDLKPQISPHMCAYTCQNPDFGSKPHTLTIQPRYTVPAGQRNHAAAPPVSAAVRVSSGQRLHPSHGGRALVLPALQVLHVHHARLRTHGGGSAPHLQQRRAAQASAIPHFLTPAASHPRRHLHRPGMRGADDLCKGAGCHPAHEVGSWVNGHRAHRLELCSLLLVVHVLCTGEVAGIRVGWAAAVSGACA